MSFSRRQFLAQSGGLVVGFSLSWPWSGRAAQPSLPGSLEDSPFIDSWIHVDPDGTVTVLTGKVELGQGIETALVQIAADELDVDIERVRIRTAETGVTADEGYTSGSNSIQQSGTAVRHAAAEARAILLDLASRRLGKPTAELEVADGRVTTGDVAVTYWELVTGDPLRRRATGTVPLKSKEKRLYIGRSVPRLDIPSKVFAEPSYVQDLRLPGMAHGRVVRPPRYEARLDAVDAGSVEKMPGVVRVVRDGGFLGVVAEREEQAIAASEKLASLASWTGGRDLPSDIHGWLEGARSDDETVAEKSDPGVSSTRRLEATYTKPYIAHASLGPSCAVAHLTSGTMAIWTHSQGVYPLRAALALTLDVPEESVKLTHMDGAGCYGHNGADDVALDAALLARAVPDRPVRVSWMREDEFAWEPFGSAMVGQLRGAVDASGRVTDWRYDLYSCPHSTRPNARRETLLASWHLAAPRAPAPPSNIPQPSGGADRNAVPGYDFPNLRVVEHFIPEMPLRVSALRSLGAFANVFALESFLDELAAAAGVDPVEFRLRHLTDPRARAVLESVARESSWGQGLASGRGRGVGFARYKNLGAYAAIVVEAAVDRHSGVVRLERAFAAVDAGEVINPDGLRNQIEGGIVQSTSWTLEEEVTFDRRGVRSLDWAGYPVLTFPGVPEVSVSLIDRPDERPLGAGEAAQGPTAAAIGNAVFDAVGARVRDLPLRPERVKDALRAGTDTRQAR